MAVVRRRREGLQEEREQLEEGRRRVTHMLDFLEYFILSNLGQGELGGLSIHALVIPSLCVSPFLLL